MANQQTTPQGFTPFFKRVSQGEDRHADIYACIAILTNKTVADIQQQAESLGVPKVGPYYPYLDGDMIAKILVAHNLVATVWKEAAGFNDLPDVAILMADYFPEWDFNVDAEAKLSGKLSLQTGGYTDISGTVNPFTNEVQLSLVVVTPEGVEKSRHGPYTGKLNGNTLQMSLGACSVDLKRQ